MTYSISARRTTSVTVSEFSAARSCAGTQTPSAMRTVRCGVAIGLLAPCGEISEAVNPNDILLCDVWGRRETISQNKLIGQFRIQECCTGEELLKGFGNPPFSISDGGGHFIAVTGDRVGARSVAVGGDGIDGGVHGVPFGWCMYSLAWLYIQCQVLKQKDSEVTK